MNVAQLMGDVLAYSVGAQEVTARENCFYPLRFYQSVRSSGQCDRRRAPRGNP